MERKLKLNSKDIEQLTTYETISDRITRMQKHAERDCGKIPYGLDWSPKLKQAGLTYLLWKCIINYLRQNVQIPQSIRDKHLTLNETVPITGNIQEAIETMRKRKEQLKVIQRRHGSLREAHLEMQAQYQASKNNTSVAAHLKQLKNSENSKRTHKRIGNNLSLPKTKLLHILLPTQTNEWEQINESISVHKLLLENSKEVMKSTKHTFPTTITFQNLFGKHDKGQHTGDILQGKNYMKTYPSMKHYGTYYNIYKYQIQQHVNSKLN